MEEKNNSHQRLVIVSNRLPISIEKEGDGCKIEPTTGGLATAFNTILKEREGAWIGWLGSTDTQNYEETLKKTEKEMGYPIIPVSLTKEDVEGYYHGFSNEIVWPLFHSFETRCNFVPDYWNKYCKVNEKFADVIAQNMQENDYLWVQDYHLMLVASYLKNKGIRCKMGFFLHIPFPPSDIFFKLPWRQEILQGLLDFDVIGVQTPNDCRNLLNTFKRIQPKFLNIEGEGAVKKVTLNESRVKVGAFPISIDFHTMEKESERKEISDRSWFFHKEYKQKQIILGLDRCDYTKGVPERIEAFYTALEKYPDMREKVSYVQVLVPSREDVPEYEKLKKKIDLLISKTNSKFGTPGWVPIHYFYRKLSHDELLAYYRATDIAYVTPLKDGQNLVCKEYCACNVDEKGVLILSEFAGASAELSEFALTINPYDTLATANALYKAYCMPFEERKYRMQNLRLIIKDHDIYFWLNSFLAVAFSKDSEIPLTVVSDYIPSIDIGL